MIKKSENRIIGQTSLILIVICLLLFVFFSHNSSRSLNPPVYHYQITNLLSTTVSSDNVARLSSVNCFSSATCKMNYCFFNINLKIITDNRLINLRIDCLQKTELLIQPVAPEWFHYCSLSSSDDNLPVLS